MSILFTVFVALMLLSNVNFSAGIPGIFAATLLAITDLALRVLGAYLELLKTLSHVAFPKD